MDYNHPATGDANAFKERSRSSSKYYGAATGNSKPGCAAEPSSVTTSA
jgi:hypothetical protein